MFNKLSFPISDAFHGYIALFLIILIQKSISFLLSLKHAVEFFQNVGSDVDGQLYFILFHAQDRLIVQEDDLLPLFHFVDRAYRLMIFRNGWGELIVFVQSVLEWLE